MKQFKKLTDLGDTADTSFFDVTINTSVSKLRKILGEPELEENYGDDKSNFEWDRYLETPKEKIIFTVYDWREFRVIEEEEDIEWHIGGHNWENTHIVRNALEKALAGLK